MSAVRLRAARVTALSWATVGAAVAAGVAILMFVLLPAPPANKARAVAANAARIAVLNRQLQQAAAVERARSREQQRQLREQQQQIRRLRGQVIALGGIPSVPRPNGRGRSEPSPTPRSTPSTRPRPTRSPTPRPTPSPSPTSTPIVCRVAPICQERAQTPRRNR